MQKKSLLPVVAISALALTFLNPSTVKAEWVPDNNEFKSYMDYRSITHTSSDQYKLQNMCNTVDQGFRMYNGRYCIALGTGFNAPVGTYVDVVLENGNVIECVVGDIKDNRDTDATNRQCIHNNSVVEFIVNQPMIQAETNYSGTVSSIDGFEGSIVDIRVYTSENLADISWSYVTEDVSSTGKAVATDKYSVDIDGTTVYFVEYASDSDCNTIEVDEETYNATVLNYSVVDIDE